MPGPTPYLHLDGTAREALSFLGGADPDTLRGWFAALSEGGTVVDALQRRPWGAFDGQVIDRFGLHWLIGYEEAEAGE